jgi:AhpD family alkylhydroperoxidase
MPDTATPNPAPIHQRMPSPVAVIPESLRALHAVSKSAKTDALPETTVFLVHLRASQINGCSFCAEMHSRELAEAGEPNERIWTVAAWREAPYFSEPERAALALTESVTRIADSPDPVPDEVWDEAARHFDEPAMGSLLLEIAQINVWNRLNVAVRQPAGAWG